jgi:hypothetical protein
MELFPSCDIETKQTIYVTICNQRIFYLKVWEVQSFIDKLYKINR